MPAGILRNISFSTFVGKYNRQNRDKIFYVEGYTLKAFLLYLRNEENRFLFHSDDIIL